MHPWYSQVSHRRVILDPYLVQLRLRGVWAPEVVIWGLLVASPPSVLRLGSQILTDQATRALLDTKYVGYTCQQEALRTAQLGLYTF